MEKCENMQEYISNTNRKTETFRKNQEKVLGIKNSNKNKESLQWTKRVNLRNI